MFSRALDLIMVAAGTVGVAAAVDALLTGKIELQGWFDYVTFALFMVAIGSITVLATACVVLMNRHLDGGGR